MSESNEKHVDLSIILNLIPWISWCFLQEYFILIFQKLFYQVRQRLTGIREPPPHSDVFFKDKNKISLFLTFLYFIYEMHGIYQSFSDNFYEILKISPYDFNEQKLKTQFRKMAIKFHPDKIISKDENKFIELQLAYKILLNSHQKFAYERLGPSAIEWSKTVSIYEVLFQSIKPCFHFYGGVVLVFLVLNFLGAKSYKKRVGFMHAFWYFYGLSLCFTLEIMSIIRSYPTFPFNYLFPRKLPFEFLNATHTFFRVFLMLLSSIERVLFKQNNIPDISTSSKKIDILSKLLLSESTDLLNMEYSCYSNKSVNHSNIMRIRLSTAYPLPFFKFWYFIPSSSDSMTIQHLIEQVIKIFSLKIEPYQLCLELEGFRLPLKSLVGEILRENDLVILKQIEDSFSMENNIGRIDYCRCANNEKNDMYLIKHNAHMNTVDHVIEDHNEIQNSVNNSNFKRKSPLKKDQKLLMNNKNLRRVPPGQGLASTKARNMRKKRAKRLLKIKQDTFPESVAFTNSLQMKKETSRFLDNKNIEIKPLKKYIKNKSKGFISKIGNTQSIHIKFNENEHLLNNKMNDEDWRNRCIVKNIECELSDVPIQNISMTDSDNNGLSNAISLSDEIPLLPKDIETLALLTEPPPIGSVIAFKHLSMSNNYEPILSDYKTAIVLDNSESNVLKLKLAKRDQKEKKVDPETGEYIYGKFGVDTDFEQNGQLILAWNDLVSPVLLEKEQSSTL
ncbi:hypothetical protein PORY_001382 [Pneumocystis oryctolagi]|uniref:Uncharacterized protein n=1 Tax=Pneumocystis oryctolagi TaxID=42067 RepID=A0ACB7CDR7_9ASCO|nr:hypothetical protein PORY_001382 [Pneumocystis oryctolagi]